MGRDRREGAEGSGRQRERGRGEMAREVWQELSATCQRQSTNCFCCIVWP